MPPKDIITDIAIHLRQKILDQMDDNEMAFFQSEFSFFEAITNISGILVYLITFNYSHNLSY